MKFVYLSRKYDAANDRSHHNLWHAECWRLQTTLLHAVQRSDILILFKAFDTCEENSKRWMMLRNFLYI